MHVDARTCFLNRVYTTPRTFHVGFVLTVEYLGMYLLMYLNFTRTYMSTKVMERFACPSPPVLNSLLPKCTHIIRCLHDRVLTLGNTAIRNILFYFIFFECELFIFRLATVNFFSVVFLIMPATTFTLPSMCRVSFEVSLTSSSLVPPRFAESFRPFSIHPPAAPFLRTAKHFSCSRPSIIIIGLVIYSILWVCVMIKITLYY